MILRKYESSDCFILAQLFFNTVHEVNKKDYSEEQLHVWAPNHRDFAAWNLSLVNHNTLIAEIDGIIVGFGDMDEKGYLDRLYVHHCYQGRGIATSIIHQLGEDALAKGIFRFTTYASITAKPFFEKQGYRVTCKNIVVREGIPLCNYFMEKLVRFAVKEE